jgi:hypothetical protein
VAALRRLQPNQVLDEDPVTRSTVTYLGTDGNLALIVEKSPRDTAEFWYDARTGQLAQTRFRQLTSQDGGREVNLRMSVDGSAR